MMSWSKVINHGRIDFFIYLKFKAERNILDG